MVSLKPNRDPHYHDEQDNAEQRPEHDLRRGRSRGRGYRLHSFGNPVTGKLGNREHDLLPPRVSADEPYNG